MDTFAEGIRFIKYFIEDVENYKIHIYYNDYEESKLEGELKINQKLPEEKFCLMEKVTEHAGEDNALHLFYERKRFFGINADGTSHHFRLGVVLPAPIVKYMISNYKNFELMNNKRLESGLQNKVFYIELLIKEAIQKKTNKK